MRRMVPQARNPPKAPMLFLRRRSCSSEEKPILLPCSQTSKLLPCLRPAAVYHNYSKTQLLCADLQSSVRQCCLSFTVCQTKSVCASLSSRHTHLQAASHRYETVPSLLRSVNCAAPLPKPCLLCTQALRKTALARRAVIPWGSKVPLAPPVAAVVQPPPQATEVAVLPSAVSADAIVCSSNRCTRALCCM